MNGKFGNNEWKIKLFTILGIVLIIAIVTGLAGGACAFIKSKVIAYQTEKAMKEEDRIQQEETARMQQEEAERIAVQEAQEKSEEKEKLAVAEKEEEKKEEKNNILQDDYIIEDSDSKYLTQSDVKNLSLKQINYAKNEIYARRGRIFMSNELQSYFNSKSWYKGTIEPNDFNENVFNDYERANARFLSNVEYSIDSTGYLLDQ